MKNIGLYIHIPFCRSKCLYCDFYSAGSRIADWDAYIPAIINELKSRKHELSGQPATLYIGGGTPSLIPSRNFIWLIDNIKNITGVTKWREFTLEVNPEDVCIEKCELWKKNGVNRISMGIQTFDDCQLKVLGRRHSSLCGEEAFNLLQKYFDNISIDLMFGIPLQTLDSYRLSLAKIIDLNPQHISSYSLMLEEGTAMTLLSKNNKLKLPGEDEWLKMFAITSETLKKAGYLHYEISNYSKPGYESIHNSNYWSGGPYLGIGPGAHSYDGNRTRRANPSRLKDYISFFSSQENDTSYFESETLSDTELREEMIMTRLRTASGLDLSEYEDRFGKKYFDCLKKVARFYVESGCLQIKDNHLHLTEKGIPLINKILVELF